MQAITNRARDAKGYLRCRKNLSVPIQIIDLGPNTQTEFQQEVCWAHSEARIEFKNNKATVYVNGKIRYKYTYEPIKRIPQREDGILS